MTDKDVDASQQPAGNRGSIGARLDNLPVTKRHFVTAAVVGIGMFFDIYEVFLAGTLSTVLKENFALEGVELNLVLGSAFLGMFIGAIGLGRISDRFGRRTAFFFTLAVYSLFTLLAAFSPNMWWLIGCRFLAGIGIGAELPICDSYIADLMPKKARGKMVAFAYTIAFCGTPIAGFLAAGIAGGPFWGTDGWRWMFVFGALGAIICWALRFFIPESPRWLESVGRHADADRVVRTYERSAGMEPAVVGSAQSTGEAAAGDAAGSPAPAPSDRRAAGLLAAASPAAGGAAGVDGGGAQGADSGAPQVSSGAELVAAKKASERSHVSEMFGPVYRKRSVMIWLFQILQPIGFYGFGTMVPLVLAAKNMDIVDTLMYSAVVFLGYPIGSAISYPIIERIERRMLIVFTAIGMAVFGLLFGFATAPWQVLLWGFIYTVMSNIFSNAFHIYQSEIYPTSLRGVGSGLAYALSRLVTAALPFVLVPLLDAAGGGAMFTLVAIAMVVLCIVVRTLGPRTTGLSVDYVSPEAGR